MKTVYPASKSKHAAWWKALRHLGLRIHPDCHWIDAAFNVPGVPQPDAELWRSHWAGCVEAAHNSNICLFVCREGETACGQLVEAGATLASPHGWVFAVSDYDFTFFHHPRCRRFKTVELALSAIFWERELARAA
jgi:hypothetical protein